MNLLRYDFARRPKVNFDSTYSDTGCGIVGQTCSANEVDFTDVGEQADLAPATLAARIILNDRLLLSVVSRIKDCLVSIISSIFRRAARSAWISVDGDRHRFGDLVRVDPNTLELQLREGGSFAGAVRPCEEDTRQLGHEAIATSR